MKPTLFESAGLEVLEEILRNAVRKLANRRTELKPARVFVCLTCLVITVVALVHEVPAITSAARSCAEASAAVEIQKMRDKGNAIYWNEQAETYLQYGPIAKVFGCYERGIAADPTESAIFQNLATALVLYRKDAAKYYNLNEQQVFDRAFKVYGQALKVDPKNFDLAVDIATTYYVVYPQRPAQALEAWQRTLELARTRSEKEGIYVHITRTHLNAGLHTAASRSLAQIRDPKYAEMKGVLGLRLCKELDCQQIQQNPVANNIPENLPLAINPFAP